MSQIDYSELAKKLTPLDRNALWNKNDIAVYLRRSRSFVDKLIASDPDFPRGLRIGGGNLLYRASDIMDYFLA